jgi:hypothetical protein
MPRSLKIAVVAAAAAGLLGGYLLGNLRHRRHESKPPVVSLPLAPLAHRQALERRSTRALVGGPSTSAANAGEAIVLPPIGTLDYLLLREGANHSLIFIRNEVVTTMVPLAKRACGPLHQVGDSRVEFRVDVAIEGGAVTLLRVSNVLVVRGAPLSAVAEACLRNLLPSPLWIPKPPPTADSPAYWKAKYTGRWSGVPDFEGDVLVEIGFRDKSENSAAPADTADAHGVP